MPKAIDLTGKTFGRWTVIGLDSSESRPGLWWQCRCECGRTVTVRSQTLLNGESTQCRSCAGKGNANRPATIKPGDEFGRLTVREMVGSKTERLWLCDCKCGRQVTVRTGNLRSGNNKSCGCLRRTRSRPSPQARPGPRRGVQRGPEVPSLSG